jgi:hypothetical protein
MLPGLRLLSSTRSTSFERTCCFPPRTFGERPRASTLVNIPRSDFPRLWRNDPRLDVGYRSPRSAGEPDENAGTAHANILIWIRPPGRQERAVWRNPRRKGGGTCLCQALATRLRQLANMYSDLFYSFIIGLVGAILFLLVDKYEPEGPLARLLQFLILFVAGVAILHKLQPYGLALF